MRRCWVSTVSPPDDCCTKRSCSKLKWGRRTQRVPRLPRPALRFSRAPQDQWYTLGAAVFVFIFRFMEPGSEAFSGFCSHPRGVLQCSICSLFAVFLSWYSPFRPTLYRSEERRVGKEC